MKGRFDISRRNPVLQIPNLHRKCLLGITLLSLAACGGGGSGSDDSPTGGGDNVPGPTIPDVTIPFAAGKKWLYNFSRTVAVPGTTTAFNGQSILHVEGQSFWQGRQAWRVMRYEIESTPAGDDAFSAKEEYFFENADGLERWYAGTSEWKRILSSMFTNFGGNTLIMTREPNSNSVTTQSAAAITVPAGNYDTVRVNAKYREGFFTGSIVDHSENHFEYYADGVGLIGSSWDFFFQDQNFGLNVIEAGGAELVAVDTGAFPALLAETEPNHSLVGAQALGDDYAIAAGETHINDAGLLYAIPDVNPNVNGDQILQDLFNFAHTGGTLRLDLRYDAFSNGLFNDLDLYLFRRGNLGQLIYVAGSTNDPTVAGNVETISSSQPAGTYTVAVQAWNTPTMSVKYWYLLR